MGAKFTRNRVEYEDPYMIWTKSIDEELDNDEIELDEWAFLYGYNSGEC